ncbi:MAG: hypothetical protein ACRD3S_17750, partial [Terracidiphilus sp.]
LCVREMVSMCENADPLTQPDDTKPLAWARRFYRGAAEFSGNSMLTGTRRRVNLAQLDLASEAVTKALDRVGWAIKLWVLSAYGREA